MLDKLIAYFKPKNNLEKPKILSDRFSYYVNHTIELFEYYEGDLDYDKLYLMLFHKGASKFETDEIYIFLPIAFIRLWLPKIKWDDSYIIKSYESDEIEKRYDETESYKIILDLSKKYFQNNPKNETIIKISSLSAEYNAINSLLQDGGELEGIKFKKTTILK